MAMRAMPPVAEAIAFAPAAGWEEMYPDYLLFGDTPSQDDERFWFFESLHHPRVLRPFETIILDAVRLGFNQFTNKTFVFPQSQGIEQKIVGGYAYFSPLQPEAAGIAARSVIFERRSSEYFGTWEARWRSWKGEVTALITEAAALDLSVPPAIEPDASISDGPHQGSALRLVSAYERLIQVMLQVWQHHFELLNLGYAAHFVFRDQFQRLFPESLEADFADLFAGTSVLLQRPHVEIARLARKARDLGVAEIIRDAAEWIEARRHLEASPAGQLWLHEWEISRDPWFEYSTGSVVSHGVV